MMNKGHILIAANPKSGAVDGLPRAEQLHQLLAQDGWSVEYTTDLDTVQTRSKELIEQGKLTTVVAGGGDGTISAIINRVGTQVPITLLPIGSENLLAKFLKVPTGPDAIVAMLRNYQVRSLDLFRANHRMFLLMASVGFDADVVRRVHQSRRSHITRWAYRRAILQAMFTYRWPAVRIRAMDALGKWKDYGSCHWVFVFNVPKYAAGITILPDAQIDDGMMDVGIFRGGNLLSGLWNYLLVFLGRHRSSSSWTEFKTQQIQIAIDTLEGWPLRVDVPQDSPAPPDTAPPDTAQADKGQCRAGQASVSYQLDGDWEGDIGQEETGRGIGSGARVKRLDIRALGVAARIIVPRS